MEIADGRVKELWVNVPAENARQELRKAAEILRKQPIQKIKKPFKPKTYKKHFGKSIFAEQYLNGIKKEHPNSEIINTPPGERGEYTFMIKDTMEQLKLMGFVTDNDATENGALEGNMGSNTETESMPLEKDPVQAQDANIEKIPANYRPEFPKAGYLVRYAKGMKARWFATQQEAENFVVQMKKEGKDTDPKAELIKYAEATKDPDYIKHVKEMKNQANINARLQWHRQKETKDGYNFKDPKEIEAVIKKLEKELKEGKHVDLDYLAGVKRALEMAKKERNMKDSFEMLRLCGITQDAYDPKKYEGTMEHRFTLRYLEASLEKFRDLAKTSKIRLVQLHSMVASGKYGSSTARELKEEERNYENILMKIQQTRSMLQRMKGQKDEAPVDVKDAYDPIKEREDSLKQAEAELERARKDLARHPGNSFFKELVIGAERNVRFAKENLERAKRNSITQDADEQWITMNGTHVKIEGGQSKAEAAKNFIKKKGGNPAQAKGAPKSTTKSYQKGDTLKSSSGKK